jgi:quinol monooxygenase YgiN
VEQARAAVGCLDFALSPDLLDDRRINILERWSTSEDLMRFRGSGPSDEQNDAIESADVREFEVPEAS